MAKRIRKTNRRRKKTTDTKEPESLALPDVAGDPAPSVPVEPIVVRKDPVLETLKKIEKNTEDTKKILKDGVGSAKKSAEKSKKSSDREERKAEAEDAKAEKIKKAEEIASKSVGDLFKENTSRSLRGFGKRVRRGISRIPENLAERMIPGPLGRVLARTYKQKRLAKEILKKRDAEMAAKPATTVDGVGSGIYKNPPQVDFTNLEPNNQDGESRAESLGETVGEKLDAIYEENRKTNFKLDKLIDFARISNEMMEQQNALLEEGQTEADRRRKAGDGSAIINRDQQYEDQGEGGGGSPFDWMMRRSARGRGGRGGFFGSLFGRKSRIGRLYRRARIGLKRGYRAVSNRLFKNVGQRSPILRAGRSLIDRGKSLLPRALGGTPSGAASGALGAAKDVAKPGIFSRAWGALRGAASWVGEKASNLGLGKVLNIFRGGGGKMLRKLIKIPIIGAAIEAGLVAMDISAIKNDPSLSPQEKKKLIGEKIASGLGSIIGGAIGAAGGAAIAGSLGLAAGPAAIITGALGAVGGGALGSYIGEKIGGAIGSGIGGEEIYNIVSSIPGVGSLIAVPEDGSSSEVKPSDAMPQGMDPTKPDLGPPTGEEIPGTEPMRPVEYDENGFPYLYGTPDPAPIVPPSYDVSAATQNMTKTNDTLDVAANAPKKSGGEQKNTIVNATTTNSSMFAPLRPRDESIQMAAKINRFGVALA